MSNRDHSESVKNTVLTALQRAVEGSEYARSFQTILHGTRMRIAGGGSASDRSLKGIIIDVEVRPRPESDSDHEGGRDTSSVIMYADGVSLNGLNDRNAFVRLFRSSTRYDESARNAVLNALIDGVVEHLRADNNPELAWFAEVPVPNSVLSISRTSAEARKSLSSIDGKSRTDWLPIMRDRQSRRLVASEIIEQALGRVLSSITTNSTFYHYLRPVAVINNLAHGPGLLLDHYVSTSRRDDLDSSAIALATHVPLETQTVEILTRLSEGMGERMADSRTRLHWKRQIAAEVQNVRGRNTVGEDDGREEDDTQRDEDFVRFRWFRLYLDPQEE